MYMYQVKYQITIIQNIVHVPLGYDPVITVPMHCAEKGCTALHYAAAAGHAECYHCLLHHGADPSIVNTSRENAFDLSRKQGKPQAISKASKWMCASYGCTS